MVLYVQKVDKLGKAGETVKVAPGYFRNHLMPKLLAVPNIEKFAHLIREQRRVFVFHDFSWLNFFLFGLRMVNSSDTEICSFSLDTLFSHFVN